MNKFKVVFALIAVFVILAAPAYAGIGTPQVPDEKADAAGFDRVISKIPEELSA